MTTTVRTQRFVEGFGLHPHADGLDVVGGRQTARLRGAERRDLTLRVTELLRSGLPAEAIAHRLGVSEEDVQARIAVLARVGAVTDREVPAGPPQLVRFLERTLGVHAAAAAALRLEQAAVGLVGDDDLCAELATQLARCGVRTVTDPDTATLVISCGAHHRAHHPGPDRPTLLLGQDGADLVVGPLCNVPGGRCSRCAPVRSGARSAVDPLVVRFAVAQTLAEVVRFLARTGHCRTTSGALRVGDRGRVLRFEPVARDATCVSCGLGADLSTEESLAYQAFQSADVGLTTNWSYPVTPIQVPRADSTIKVVPMPPGDDPLTPDQRRLLAATAAVVLPKDGTPSIGGTRLLSVFVGGRTERGPFLHLLDRRDGVVRSMPTTGLADQDLFRADGLTVLVTATLSRAENLFGSKAKLAIYQDTGFLTGTLGDALSAAGVRAQRRPTPDAPGHEVHRLLGLDPTRDVLTAIVDLHGTPAATPRVRRRTAAIVDSDDLTAVLASAPGVFVRCYRVPGLDEGLYRLSDNGLRPEDGSVAELDRALADRGLTPAALVVPSTDLGHALATHGRTGIATTAVEHAEIAVRVRRAAAARGLDALLCADLPTTAVTPDGRQWRTAHRGFAAVALGPAGTLDGAQRPEVRW